MLWINRINHLFWTRAGKASITSVRSVAAYRIVLGCSILLFLMPGFQWLSQVPKAFFYPQVFSIANLVDSFPGKGFFVALDAIVLTSLVCFTLGVKARWSGIVFFLACMVGLSFQYSFGKVDHVNLIYITVACMSFSGWGTHLAIVPDKPSKYDHLGKCMALLSIIVCFSMFSAGLDKALFWVDFDISQNGFLSWYYTTYFINERQFLLAPFVHYFPLHLLDILDYAAVIFELSPLIFLLFSRKAWKLWLLVACSFHLMNTLLLNITFVQNCFVYLIFLNHESIYKHLDFLRQHAALKNAAVIMMILLGSGIFIFNFYTVDLHHLISPRALIQFRLYVGMLVWIAAISIFLKSIFLKPNKLDKNKPAYALSNKQTKSRQLSQMIHT